MECRHIKTEVEIYPDGSLNVVCVECGEVLEHWEGGIKMLHVGKESYVDKDKILAITNADSAPLQRQRQKAEDEKKYISCSNGKKTRSLIHLENGFIIGSSRTVETLVERLERGRKE